MWREKGQGELHLVRHITTYLSNAAFSLPQAINKPHRYARHRRFQSAMRNVDFLSAEAPGLFPKGHGLPFGRTSG